MSNEKEPVKAVRSDDEIAEEMLLLRWAIDDVWEISTIVVARPAGDVVEALRTEVERLRAIEREYGEE